MSEEGEALPQMNDGQSTTHPERDPAPFKVHLLTRAGRVMRAAASRCEPFPIRTKPSDLRVASLAGTTRCIVPRRRRLERPLVDRA
jgi:hypothetical protein